MSLGIFSCESRNSRYLSCPNSGHLSCHSSSSRHPFLSLPVSTTDICLVGTLCRHLSSLNTIGICPVSTSDNCPASRASICLVSTEDICPIVLNNSACFANTYTCAAELLSAFLKFCFFTRGSMCIEYAHEAQKLCSCSSCVHGW